MPLKFRRVRPNTNKHTTRWLSDTREIILLLILLDLTVWATAGFGIYCLLF